MLTSIQPLQLTFRQGLGIAGLTIMGVLGLAIRLLGWVPARNTQQNKSNLYRTTFLRKLVVGVVVALFLWLWLAVRLK